MPNQPLVSVIMNCYNSETYLKEAIQSVLNQTYGNFEIIFWDNQSIDKSAQIVQSCNDERIKYFYAQNHTSLGEGRNHALGKCSGEYIAFLDCDDQWFPNKLEVQLNYFQENPNIFFSFGSYIRYFQISKTKVTISPCSKKVFTFLDLFSHYPINLQTVLFHKRLLESVDHHFDNQLHFSEEYDFFLRLLYTHNAVCIPVPLAIYRIHEDQITSRYFERASIENELILTKLLSLYPELSTSPQTTHFKGKTAYFRAKHLMQTNQKKAATAILSPYKFFSPVFFLLYVLSFSHIAWDAADKFKNKGY
jgi:glycosyltransferase involved in cell wall biosynthesis